MKYYLIDMGNIPDAAVVLVNQAFELWRNVYRKELESRQLKLNEDDFWSCRLLAILQKDADIVGLHIYNAFDLRTEVVNSHHYFSQIPVERLQNFRDLGTRRIMSMEYLLVNPLYRGRKSSIRWGEVIIGLGFHVMVHSPWDAIIGIAREDKKVNEMVLKMGGSQMDSLVKNQTPCRVVFMTKQSHQPHENLETRKVIEQLWWTKKNYAPELILDEQISVPRAA